MKKKNWKDSMFLPSHVEIPSPQHSSTFREEEEVAMRQKQQFCSMDSNSLSVVSLGSSINSENVTHISNSNRLRRSLSLSAIMIHHSFESNEDNVKDDEQTDPKKVYDLRPRK